MGEGGLPDRILEDGAKGRFYPFLGDNSTYETGFEIEQLHTKRVLKRTIRKNEDYRFAFRNE